MLRVSLSGIKRILAYGGAPVEPTHGPEEIGWFVRQWKRWGLMYSSESLDRLLGGGTIDACFVVRPAEARPGGPIQAAEEPAAGTPFIPEPFPVPAEAYDAWFESGSSDVIGFLGQLALYKRIHENGGGTADFPSNDAFGLYCAFIHRFYDTRNPHRARKMHWILFHREGAEFFSRTFGLPAERLAKFVS